MVDCGASEGTVSEDSASEEVSVTSPVLEMMLPEKEDNIDFLASYSLF